MSNRNVFGNLTDDWSNINKIVIFGFGKMGRGNIDALMKNFDILKIVDNNPLFKGQNYRGIEIINLETFVDIQIKEKIVVVTSGNRYVSIAKDLSEYGYREYVDFCDFATFCKDFFWNDRRILFLGRLTFNITTFCTLNCKNCTMLTPYNKNKVSFDIELLKRDVKLTFGIVDYVSNFIILGGEPFLHRSLIEFIEFIGKYYRDRIGNLQLITNGTVIASEKLLVILKKYNVEVRISDYTNRVDYSEKINKLCKDLDLYKISYVRYANSTWLDMGFPAENVDFGDNAMELRDHMLKCNPNCQNINDGKLYYCAQGWAAEQSGCFKLNESDYLNLQEIINYEDKKERFRKFYFGDLDKGYFSFCKVCRGWDTDKVIPAGIQYCIEKNGESE